MVRVGFWQPPEVKPAASITKRFVDVVGLLELVEDRLLRVHAHPRHAHLVDAVAGDAVRDHVGPDVLGPRRLQLCAAVSIMSGIIFFSLSPQLTWNFRTGMP